MQCSFSPFHFFGDNWKNPFGKSQEASFHAFKMFVFCFLFIKQTVFWWMVIETIIPLHLLHQLLLLQGCQTQGNSSIRYKILSARSEFIVRSVIYEEKLIIFLRRHQASPCPRFYRYSWMTSVSSACALIWATFKVADLYFFRHSSEQLMLQFKYCSAELSLHTFSSERWKCL